MCLLTFFLAILISIFVAIPSTYYLYLWFASFKPWNFKIDSAYYPPVTIIIPVHNEEKIIEFKLKNLNKVRYPKEKMQIIVANDGSTDETVCKILKFVNKNPELNIKILNYNTKRGKSYALNDSLKIAKNDIIIVTDADTFWAPDVLEKALPFLSDSSIGAISGRQKLLDVQQTICTKTEKFYLDFTYQIIKLGESKIFSTILFHGLFSAYKRKYLDCFNQETDDSGTALDIVQKGGRTIYVPDAVCYEIPITTWRRKFSIKLRRASQLVRIYIKCLKNLLKGRLLLPKRIAIPQIYLHLINPVIFLLSILTFFLLPFYNLSNFLILTFILLVIIVIPKTRIFFIEVLQDNIILLCALFTNLLGRKYIAWNPIAESRSMVTERDLEKENLI
jgi:cellulose synthase/poly-beta-1,6-N-acetylglucosamine synthase-like glycosyltransferase